MCELTLHKYVYSFGYLLYSGIVKETRIKKSPPFLQEIEKVQHMRYRNIKAKRVGRQMGLCKVYAIKEQDST